MIGLTKPTTPSLCIRLSSPSKVDMGVTCVLLDNPSYAPSPIRANHSCRTSKTSLLSDEYTCDSLLIVESETLKKEVVELTNALSKCYLGEG